MITSAKSKDNGNPLSLDWIYTFSVIFSVFLIYSFQCMWIVERIVRVLFREEIMVSKEKVRDEEEDEKDWNLSSNKYLSYLPNLNPFYTYFTCLDSIYFYSSNKVV